VHTDSSASLQRRKALTLVEMLAVVAIIVILVALLLPVISRTKASGKRAQNLSNLMQIGVATGLYVADHDDVMAPFVMTSAQPFHTTWWHGRLIPGGEDSFSAVYRRKEGLLGPYTRGSDIQDCPVGKSLLSPFQQTKDSELMPAYAANRLLWVGLKEMEAGPVHLAKVEDPSSTMSMLDAIDTSHRLGPAKTMYIWPPVRVDAKGGQWRDQWPAGSARMHGRHAGLACVLWADGHVKAIRPVFRDGGSGPVVDDLRDRGVGELARVPLPMKIASDDPRIPEYNYYFSLNKSLGR
jgi:prepilin-type processing-associated H-X9-DG protein